MMKKWCLVFLAVTLCLVSASALSGGVDEYPSAYPVPALTGNYVKDFISVARSQVGYTASSDNTSEYWVWAGSKGTTHAWCSEFVSWCAAKANIPETIVPLARSSAKFRTFVSDQGRLYSFAYGCTSSTCGCVGLASGTLSAADLQPGDILLIDTDGQMDNGPDHTELVAKVQGSVITTIDGNVGGKRNADGTKGFAEVREEPLDLERYPVHGVCRPNYTGLADGVAINEITFPDPAFREHVKSYIDWNGNLRLDADELAKVTIINVDTEYLSAPLYSLQGIEYFTALEELYCSANNLTELDLSGNTKLRVLYCWNNSISSVNLSGNSSLEQLIITNNQLTELDVSSCQNLKKLICSYNPLTSLKLGNNALQELECGTTNITELDIRRCPLLVNMVVNTDPTFYGGERPPLEWLLGNCRLLVDHGIRVVYNDQGIFYCHDPKKHDRVDSTAENTGIEEYWQCYVCNTLFSDADGKNPIDEPPVIPVKKYTGAEFTSNEGLAAKLDLLFTGQVAIFSNTNFGYPIGSRLNNNMLYKWNNNRYGGYQCYAYANAAYNYLFGEDPGPDNSNYSKSKLISGVKGLSGLTYEILSGAGVGCGAYIRTTANPNGDFDPSNAHSMIVLGYGKKGITILHGNADTNGLVTVSENSWDFFNNNLFTGKNHRVCYVLQPNATLRIPNPTPDPEPKPDQPVAQSAMSKAEFDAAALNSQVCIDAYVQAAQGWYNRDGTGRIALYLQSGEDGYFAYDVLAGQAESAKLVPGTKIRLKGVKTEWAGEVEIIDGT